MIRDVFAGEGRALPRYVLISASNSAGVDPISGYLATAFPASSVSAALSTGDDCAGPGLTKRAGGTGDRFFRRARIDPPAISPATAIASSACTNVMCHRPAAQTPEPRGHAPRRQVRDGQISECG